MKQNNQQSPAFLHILAMIQTPLIVTIFFWVGVSRRWSEVVGVILFDCNNVIIKLDGERNSLSLYFELFPKDDFTPPTMTQ